MWRQSEGTVERARVRSRSVAADVRHGQARPTAATLAKQQWQLDGELGCACGARALHTYSDEVAPASLKGVSLRNIGGKGLGDARVRRHRKEDD